MIKTSQNYNKFPTCARGRIKKVRVSSNYLTHFQRLTQDGYI